MKKIFSIFGALLAGALMFSCADQYQEEITFGTEITASVESLAQFAKENAEAQTLEVTANGEWMAVAPAWVEVTPAFGGEGTTTVSVRAKDNYELVDKDGELVSELGPKRSATLTFAGEGDAKAEVAISQDGDANKWDPAVPRPVTMQYFNEVATTGDGFTYILTGKITEVANTLYGNFYFEDETGTAYVYGLLTPDGEAQKQWAAAGLKVNDVITVMGARADYKGDPQMTNAVYVSHEVGEASPIVDATIAEFLAAEKSGTQYRISGVVTNIANAEYGNIYIKDATGEVYVYGVGAKGEFETMGVEVGDIVTLISNRGEYNGTPQAANSTLEKKEDVTAVASVTDFLALEESGAYYMLTGTVSGMAGAGEYGNIYLNDEASSIYVYGLLSGYKGEKKQFPALVEATGLKDGDTLTIIGKRTSYNGTAQVGSAFYFSHEAGEGGGEEPEGGVLAWGSADFAAIQAAVGAELNANTLANVVATDDLTVNADGITYKGLELILGGGKFKFGTNYGVASQEGDKPTRMQFGGTGNTTKQVAVFEVPAAGTLKIDAVSSSKEESRSLVVAIDGNEVGQYPTVLQGQEATGEIFTIDCSAATAGSKIYIYSAKSGINLFTVEYTY